MSGQGAMIGAAVGATYNAARGEDPLKGAMYGAAIGGTGGAMGVPGLSGAAAGTGATAAGTGSALTGAGASTSLNTAFMNAAGVNAGANATMGAGQAAAPGIFSNVTAPLSVSQPLSSAAGQTAGMERTFGPVESLLNPNIQSSSLNNESLLQRLGTGAGELGQFAQQNPVLTQMAAQTGQSLLQQREPQLQSPGLMRGSPSQVAAPQYQVGIPKVSLI
jgi:hypothetical protein